MSCGIWWCVSLISWDECSMNVLFVGYMGPTVVIESWLLLAYSGIGLTLRLANCEAQSQPRCPSCCASTVSMWLLLKTLGYKTSLQLVISWQFKVIFPLLVVFPLWSWEELSADPPTPLPPWKSSWCCLKFWITLFVI